METEIKLLSSPASRALVEAHPLFSAAAVRRVHARSTYYDTPDLALRARGLALRIRRTEDGFVQTVKSREGDGFASRGEWEWPVASEALDRDAVAREPAVLALLGPDLARVEPLFTTDVRRELRLLRLDGGTVVESATDVGQVQAGPRSAPLDELELELKGGPVGAMMRLAAELARSADLRFGPDSKSERGYALLTDDPPPRHRATPLPRDVTLGDAFPRAVAAAAAEFAAELSLAARGDVEGVHRLRAAIRRLRTILALFAPHTDPAVAASFDARLRELGRVLGGGRDWDVFLTETLEDAAADVGHDRLATLRAAAQARSARARIAVAAAVEGPLPTALLLGLAAWTADGGWLKPGRDADRPFLRVVPKLLDRLERRALKRGRHIASLDAEDLHGLRKSLKKLRYASEDVEPLFSPRATARYVGAIKGVLKDLGHINDAAVTVERVHELGREAGTDLAEPAAAMLDWSRRRDAGRARHLRRSWREFRRADAFWG